MGHIFNIIKTNAYYLLSLVLILFLILFFGINKFVGPEISLIKKQKNDIAEVQAKITTYQNQIKHHLILNLLIQ
jgi:p-aminobenzoyl-glutamate transporter AbgT